MPSKKAGKKAGKKKSAKKTKKKGFGFKTFLIPALIILLLVPGYYYAKNPDITRSAVKKALIRLKHRLTEMSEPIRIEEWKATLYFADDSSDFLVKEYRTLRSVKNPVRMSEVLIKELIKGPDAKGVRTLPEQTRVLSVKESNNGLIIIDLSKELTELHPGGSSAEIMTVYSIVNTLTTNINNVKMVKLTQEGKTLDTIAGHIDCHKNFYPDQTLVR